MKILAVAILPMALAAAAQVGEASYPEPDPPKQIQPGAEPEAAFTAPAAAPAAVAEWTFHKTPDGRHPNGDEQALLWLLNRARQNPAAEGVWLAGSQDPVVATGRDFFQVDKALLQSEFAGYPPQPPAAFDVRLYQAALAHAQALIARDSQDHQHQIERIQAAGFRFQVARGNVFSFAENALNAHAALNIDWGEDDAGMQPGRPHRQAIMALDGNYTNVGIAALPETRPATQVGPLVTVANYCEAQADGSDHFNRFVVGTVWRDANHNDRYDPGEGLAGVMVLPDGGGYFALTAAGGGYAFPLTTSGPLELTFSGGGIGADATRRVTAGRDSLLVDYRVGEASPADFWRALAEPFNQALARLAAPPPGR